VTLIDDDDESKVLVSIIFDDSLAVPSDVSPCITPFRRSV